ncbi:MAG TPA: hypothetical protein VEC60_21570 [Reyranella sp.]|nr:hypothetical protein [Reyranella sp.]
MSEAFEDLSDWIFEVTEQSAGVYAVTGRNSAGWSVAATGIDPEAVLQQCKGYAIDLETRERNRSMR